MIHILHKLLWNKDVENGKNLPSITDAESFDLEQT